MRRTQSINQFNENQVGEEGDFPWVPVKLGGNKKTERIINNGVESLL